MPVSMNKSVNVLSKLEELIPKSQNDPRVISDSFGKIEKVRKWMHLNQWNAVVISRIDNFAWLTTGGDNHVLKNTEIGVGSLLITPEKKYLLAHQMDGERIQELSLEGHGYELKTLSWNEGDPRSLAFGLCGSRIAADSVFPGTHDKSERLIFSMNL